MAEHAAEDRRRKWLIALGAAALLMILLALTLSFCDNTAADDRAAPGTTASTETLPPVAGPGSPGTLSPRTSAAGSPKPSASVTANDPGAGGSTADPATTTPLATKSPSSSRKPTTTKPATSTKPTPAGGVDAGGGAGLSGRRASLLVAGVFLLLAALVTARFAFGRAARG